MAKRMSNKKRQSRRRALRGGADTPAPADAASAAPVDVAAVDATPAAEGSFMDSLFSTESKPEASAVAAEEAKPADEATVAEEVRPAAEAAVVMATTYKAKKTTAKKGKKSKKDKKGCKTKKGNCKQWFKMNKNKLCATASPSM